jgi:hypothetical protein
LVGKPERKGPLGRPRHRWEDNIRMDLKEVGWGGGIDWIDLAPDRVRWGGGACECGNERWDSVKCGEFRD